MNPQTQQEGKRILGVMDDLLDDLAVLASLPPYLSSMPAKDLQHLLDAFHDDDGAQEVNQQLSEHYELERRLESAAGDMTSDDIEDLHFSTRSLIDTMRYAGYPSKYTPAAPSAANIVNFRSIIQTLRGLLLDRLNTTVEDDFMKFAILNDTVNREKNASADVQALTREHVQEKESRAVEVERRDVTIKKLREELSAVRDMAGMDREKLLVEIARMQEANEVEYDQKFEKLKAEVESIEAKYKNTRDKCVADETAARQARSKKETALSQIIQHYDQEMTSSTKKIEELQAEIDADREEVGNVETELTKLVSAREADEAEGRLDDQRQTHGIVIAARRTESAKIIQAFYRAHAFRLAMANKGKKKGKGKKK